MALLPTSPMEAGPSQPSGTSQPTSSGRAPDRERYGAPERTRSSQVRRKSTGSVRSGKGQSPAPWRTSDRSRTPDRARTHVSRRTPEREATPDRGKAPMAQASPTSVLDCQMLEPYAHPPSRAASTRDPRTTSVSGGRNPEPHTGSDPSPIQSVRKGNTVSRTPRSGTPEPGGPGDSEEEIAPSPNMRRVFTRLQDRKMASPRGGSSAVSGPVSHSKEGAAEKKHRCT